MSIEVGTGMIEVAKVDVGGRPPSPNRPREWSRGSGQQSEEAWWRVVADRVGIGPELLSGLRDEINSAGAWDDPLLDVLWSTRGRVRPAILSKGTCHPQHQRLAGWSFDQQGPSGVATS
jgi:hypothetical protein